MCQSKSAGGKRCQIHLSGSAAAIAHASAVANVDQDVARRVFTDLRQEGKNMDMADPTREEVVHFADTQRVSAYFDDSIPSAQRNTIIRRWSRVLKENLPTAATFHAWKNAISETMRRNQRRLLAVGMSSVIAFTAACSGQGGAETPAPPASSPSVSAPADPSPSASESPSAGSDIGVEGYQGLREVTLENGSYTQITPAPDNPLMQYNEAVVNQGVKDKYSQEQILAAQQAAVRYAVEEGFDSRIADNPTPESINQWVAETKDKFAPEVQGNVAEAAQRPNTDGLVNSYSAQDRGYSLVADGSARVVDAGGTVKNVYLNDAGDIIVSMDFIGTRKGEVTEGDGLEVMTGDLNYAVSDKDGDGVWKLTGWKTTWRGVKSATQTAGDIASNG